MRSMWENSKRAALMPEQLQPGARATIDRVKVNCAETMRNGVGEVQRCPLPARELFFYFADCFPLRTILRWLRNCGWRNSALADGVRGEKSEARPAFVQFG